MMKHRKRDHSNIVKLCSQYQQNRCRFQNESCWFKHENETENPHEERNNDEAKNEQPEMVFRPVSEDLDPPIRNKNQERERQKENA